MTISKMTALAGAALLFSLSACGQSADDTSKTSSAAEKADQADLVETLGDAGDLSTAAGLIKQAGLEAALEGPAPYTLFLPSNEALQAVNGEQLDRLKSDAGRPELIALLRYHIAPGVLAQEDLVNAIKSGDGTVEIASVAGSNLEFTQQGNRIGIGSGDQAAMVTGEPIVAGNGVIYTIDRLIQPDGSGAPSS
ncbi:fasciclin domain-containing protein [Novosphingopyxis iocasae]|uniref:fasciclin domain-containing protein n=1 Tax=Novosphingopyxis iocasae TaxID=2762729 RepID=UPI00165197CD|nr:fasciclin domain-containing protein [Novosphingopyxis iocasae]